MNKPVIIMKNTNDGFSLVELLVTITIMVILLSLLIPNIRTVTKDRNAREAARTVSSLFSTASQRAATDGIAGVVLFRNPNFVLDDGDPTTTDFQFAVNRMALLRSVPDYAGDFTGATAIISTTTPAPVSTPVPPVDQQVVISIPLPVEQLDLSLVSPGDRISFNNNRFDYPITNVNPMLAAGVLDVTIRIGPPVPSALSLPNPTAFFTAAAAAGTGVPFVVKRSPRVLTSSTLELPSDLIVDLRFSGFNSTDSVIPGGSAVVPGNAPGFDSTVFEPVPLEPDVLGAIDVPFLNRNIAILFGEDGQLDQMGQVTAQGGIQYAHTSRALGPLFLFVSEYDATSISSGNEVNPLLSDTNLWVSVSNTTGAVNVGYNDPTGITGLSLGDLAARYQGTGSIVQRRADRAVFNGLISAARNDSVIGSAAQ